MVAIKDFRYHISLYVIVPVIFAGIAFLSALLTFLLAQHYHRLGQDGDRRCGRVLELGGHHVAVERQPPQGSGVVVRGDEVLVGVVRDEEDVPLVPSTFTIGFARRFSTYKRADLIFDDIKNRDIRIIIRIIVNIQ